MRTMRIWRGRVGEGSVEEGRGKRRLWGGTRGLNTFNKQDTGYTFDDAFNERHPYQSFDPRVTIPIIPSLPAHDRARLLLRFQKRCVSNCLWYFDRHRRDLIPMRKLYVGIKENVRMKKHNSNKHSIGLVWQFCD